MSFHFQIGNTISDNKGSIKILEQFRDGKNQKCYKYQCMKCGYIGTNTETKIKNRKVRCSVCCKNPKIIVAGINNIGTTHPWIKDYLINNSDADKYLSGSNKNILTKCPICKNIQYKRINRLIKNGFSCSVCSNNISYPNKLMYEILTTLQIKFEREKVFIWSDNKQYDFYIPSLKCIIEMNGGQHYADGFNKKEVYTKSNDIYKRQLAIHSGVIEHYIVIDCRKSDCEYIYSNLCKEPLLVNQGVLNINIDECDKRIRQFNSLYQEIVDLWESGMSTSEIGNKLKYSYVTISKYLKQAAKMGMTNYNARHDQNNRTKKKILDLETGIEYESILDCSKKIGKSRTYIKYHEERFVKIGKDKK